MISPLRNAKYLTRDFMGRHALTFRLLRVNATFRRRMAAQGKVLTIDGFPRSANSAFYNAFMSFNPALDRKVAHHLHAPMQVIRSVRLGIPCVLLVRDPVETLSSLLIVDGRLDDTVAIRSYLRFHECVMPYLADTLVVDFPEATGEFPEVVERLNRRFGTDFAYGELDEERLRQIRDYLVELNRRSGQPANLVAVPTAEKEAAKVVVRERLTAHPLLPRAREVYGEVLSARRAG